MNNSPLGGPTNRGAGGSVGTFGSSRVPGTIGHADAHDSALQRYAAHAAHHLTMAMDAVSTNSVIGQLLGHDSFAAGLAFGMARNLAVSVYELGDLLKIFALAEYDEVRRSGGFRKRIERSMLFGPAGASADIGMMSLATLWPGFDHAAEDAHAQREALLQMLAYAFEHPGEILETISDSQVRKFHEFKAALGRHSLSGDFHAGDLCGHPTHPIASNHENDGL